MFWTCCSSSSRSETCSRLNCGRIRPRACSHTLPSAVKMPTPKIGSSQTRRLSPRPKSLNWVASIAWTFLGSQVEMARFPMTLCSKVRLPMLAYRSIACSGNRFFLSAAIIFQICSMPNGHTFAHLCRALHPRLLAFAAYRLSMIVDRMNLYRR